MNQPPLFVKQVFALVLGFAVACGGQLATDEPEGTPDDSPASDAGAVDAALPHAEAGVDASGPLPDDAGGAPPVDAGDPLPVDAGTPSFGITLAPSAIESRPDGMHDVVVTLDRIAGFTGDVVLAFDTAGDVAVDPFSATIPAGATTTTIRAHVLAHAAPLSASTVLVRASSGSLEKTATLALSVTVPHGYPDRSVPEVLFTNPGADYVEIYRRRSSDGVIWACGRIAASTAVYRLHPDGNYDDAFGAHPLPPPAQATAFSMRDCTVDGSGLLVAGQADGGVGATVLRIDGDGAIDTSFGVEGFVRLAHGSSARAVRSDGMGRLLVLTTEGTAVTTSWLSRLHADGSVDPTFGTGGTVQLGAAGTVMAASFAVRPDGGAVVAGHHVGSDFNAVLNVVRVSPTGVVDTALAPDGIISIRPPSQKWFTNEAELDGEGRLLVTGRDERPLSYVARILPSGAPDAAFGTAGFLTLEANLLAVRGLVPQADGSLLVGVAAKPGAFYRYGALRLDASGVPDPTFGTAGLATGCPASVSSCLAAFLLPVDATRFLMIGSVGSGRLGALHFWH